MLPGCLAVIGGHRTGMLSCRHWRQICYYVRFMYSVFCTLVGVWFVACGVLDKDWINLEVNSL